MGTPRVNIDGFDDAPIGDLIARVRTQRGKSQDALVDALCAASGNVSVDRSYISRWENGHRIPTPYWRRHLSTVLGIPEDVLDRAVAVARARRPTASPVKDDERASPSAQGGGAVAPAAATEMAAVQQADQASTLEEILDLWETVMRRRTFLARATALTAATLLPAPETPVLPAIDDIPELLKASAELTAGYRRLDRTLGPNAVYAPATAHLHRLTAWLEQARNPTEWRQVAPQVTEASIFVAWLHFDLERYHHAADVYRQAFEIAHGLRDPGLGAFLASRMSRTLSECDRHVDALAFAAAAEQIAATATPAVRSWLAVTRAYVHGCLGDARACLADLDQAARLLDKNNDEPAPSYIGAYDQRYLRQWSTHALLKLAAHGDSTAQSHSAVDQAVGAWSLNDGQVRGRRSSGEVLTAAAWVRLTQQEIEETARLTSQAYVVAAQTHSPRVLHSVLQLRKGLSPYRNTRAVRTLDDRMLTGQ